MWIKLDLVPYNRQIFDPLRSPKTMHIGYNLRSFEFPRLLSQLQGLIPKEGLSQHETEFYQFLHEFLPERSESWAEVVEFLLCIFQNRDKWDMEATFTWDEEGEDTFEYTAKEITELVEEDFQSSPYRDIDVNLSEISVLHRNIAASKQPELWSTEKKWRDLLSDAIRDIREDYLRNPVGYSNEETVLGTTIFGHMLGRETVRKIGDEPQYFNDSTFRWARSKRQGSKDLMELWVTATCAGQVTAPHEDGPGPEAMIFHIFGIKLWVIWDGNEENQQTLSNHRTPWRIDIKWAMKNLRGAKVRISMVPHYTL